MTSTPPQHFKNAAHVPCFCSNNKVHEYNIGKPTFQHTA